MTRLCAAGDGFAIRKIEPGPMIREYADGAAGFFSAAVICEIPWARRAINIIPLGSGYVPILPISKIPDLLLICHAM